MKFLSNTEPCPAQNRKVRCKGTGESLRIYILLTFSKKTNDRLDRMALHTGTSLPSAGRSRSVFCLKHIMPIAE